MFPKLFGMVAMPFPCNGILLVHSNLLRVFLVFTLHYASLIIPFFNLWGCFNHTLSIYLYIVRRCEFLGHVHKFQPYSLGHLNLDKWAFLNSHLTINKKHYEFCHSLQWYHCFCFWYRTIALFRSRLQFFVLLKIEIWIPL